MGGQEQGNCVWLVRVDAIDGAGCIRQGKARRRGEAKQLLGAALLGD